MGSASRSIRPRRPAADAGGSHRCDNGNWQGGRTYHSPATSCAVPQAIRVRAEEPIRVRGRAGHGGGARPSPDGGRVGSSPQRREERQSSENLELSITPQPNRNSVRLTPSAWAHEILARYEAADSTAQQCSNPRLEHSSSWGESLESVPSPLLWGCRFWRGAIEGAIERGSVSGAGEGMAMAYDEDIAAEQVERLVRRLARRRGNPRRRLTLAWMDSPVTHPLDRWVRQRPSGAGHHRPRVGDAHGHVQRWRAGARSDADGRRARRHRDLDGRRPLHHAGHRGRRGGVMDLPPPNTTTLARTAGPKPKLHAVTCTIECDEATVRLTYRREGRSPHLVEEWPRDDMFHLGPILDRLVPLD